MHHLMLFISVLLQTLSSQEEHNTRLLFARADNDDISYERNTLTFEYFTLTSLTQLVNLIGFH